MIGSVSNVSAVTNGNSENQLSDNTYAFGNGILEFQEISLGPCAFTIPNYSIKSVNATQSDSLLNLDDFKHNFFIVLGNHNNTPYHFLQIGLPGGTGFPSYLLDLKNNDGEKLRGEFYVDYENLAVVLESDVDQKLISDDSFEKYFTGPSKDITYSTHTFGPGNYTFGAILLKSASSSWVNDETCVIHLEWPFDISKQGDVSAHDPSVDVGKLVDVTKEFSPLKQHRAGVNPDSIECKPGLGVILHTSSESGDKRPACVTPETKIRLAERGWAKN